jgi:hypothetical protein
MNISDISDMYGRCTIKSTSFSTSQRNHLSSECTEVRERQCEKIVSIHWAQLKNEKEKKTYFSPLEMFFMLSKPKLFFKLCTHAEKPL